MASNKTYDQISVGDTATISKICTANDLYVYAHASGNTNPLHLPDTDWTGDGKFDPPVAPSMWVAAVISAVLGNILPGPGTIYRSQTFSFHERVALGDQITVTVEVIAKEADRLVRLSTLVTGPSGHKVAEGIAEVTAPSQTIVFDSKDLPPLLIEKYRHFDRIIAAAKALPPLTTAVVVPSDPNSLGGAILAAKSGLITPILIGVKSRIEAAAREIGEDISGYEIMSLPTDADAPFTAVDLVNKGKAGAIMKGNLHTDDLLHHIVKREGGLRTKRRISHVFVMDVPSRSTPVIISDAAINIAPDLMTKKDIVQNAIDAAIAIGIPIPKVGILSAVETVNPAIPSSMEAAILSKMADRGQIKGGMVDGPLAMDNAIDIQAARTKGITSLVAGHAEVLIVPNLESGNMLAKELTFVAHAETAGLVLGARVPVMLTSRADDDRARLASCALALLYNAWRQTGESAISPEDIAAEESAA